jgi:hypothetical protein
MFVSPKALSIPLEILMPVCAPGQVFGRFLTGKGLVALKSSERSDLTRGIGGS